MRKIMVMLMCLLLAGCTIPPTERSRFVTAMQIEANRPELCRSYTDPEKMERVLLYLRTLERGATARTDPERFSGVSYHIQLCFSNGDSRHIFQRADRFLSEDFHSWKEVKYDTPLSSLLQEMPND